MSVSHPSPFKIEPSNFSSGYRPGQNDVLRLLLITSSFAISLDNLEILCTKKIGVCYKERPLIVSYARWFFVLMVPRA